MDVSVDGNARFSRDKHASDRLLGKQNAELPKEESQDLSAIAFACLPH
jgi:hypothetical protein